MRNLCGPGDEDDDGGEELQDLGLVSAETRGAFFGHFWDGGFGVRPP